MRRLGTLLALALAGCPGAGDEAGVGSDRTGCAEPGTNSVLIGQHSCACESGFEWCSGALDEFECCPSVGEEGETGDPPAEACGPAQLEAILCIDDDAAGPGSETWACNGDEWVPVPGLADFECRALGYHFAFGCTEGPQFVCGYGPGSSCEGELGACLDDAIIDTCVWGQRTFDYCRRLCDDLEVWGPGFTMGACVEVDGVGTCECS